MKLLLTGTASGIPVSDRRHSSALLRIGGTGVLIDAGEGISRALLDLALSPEEITAVCITHTHADHLSGLPMLLQGWHLAGRETPLDILLPPGREDWFRSWLAGMYIFEEKWSFPLRLLPLAETRIGAATLLPLPNRHLDRVRALAEAYGVPAQSYSLRIESDDGVLLVSSDIAGKEDIAVHAGRSDVCVIDTTHVPVSEIESLADEFPALRIVCTHIPPELESRLPHLKTEAVRRFGERICFAYDGMEIELQRDTTWK